MIWQIRRSADLSRGAFAGVKGGAIQPIAYPGDGNAHEWVVTVTDNGAPVDLTGATVTGYFYRHADGATPFATGAASGNVATVQIPSAAYALGGYVTGILRAAKGDVIMTLDSIVFAVGPNVTGEIIDPGTVIQDIDALVAAIDSAVASIPADYTALEGEVDDLKSALNNGNGAVLCDIVGRYIKSDGTIATSGAYRMSDYVEIPATATTMKIGNSFNLGNTTYHLSPPGVFFDENKAIVSAISSGTDDYLTVAIPKAARYVRVNQPNESHASVNTVIGGVWFLPSVADYSKAKADNLTGSYEYTGSFTAGKQIVNTGIKVSAGVTYTIVPQYTANDYATSRINVFSNGTGGSANYGILFADGREIDFPCAVDGYLCLYNVWDYVGPIKIDVYANVGRINREVGATYYVGQYERESSLTALLLKLKDDKSNKTIVIRGGDYDIFAEYKALQNSGLLPSVPTSDYDPALGFLPYNVFIPDNTHIIGEGLVRLNYMPSASQTFENETKTLSPINTAGPCILENVEIHCKNGRYCIHDDALQDPAYNGAIKRYINVRAIKYTADEATFGTAHNFGCGIARAMRIEFDNCYFETKSTYAGARTVYFHNRAVVGGVELQEKMSSNIVLKNCVIKSASQNLALYFGNIGAENLNIRVDVDSCWIGGNIVSADEASAGTTGNNPNSFNIRTLLSKYGAIIVRDPSNPYPPVEFSAS